MARIHRQLRTTAHSSSERRNTIPKDGSVYPTTNLKDICGGVCVIVQCPDPKQYLFPTDLKNAFRDKRMVDINGIEVLDLMCTEIEHGRAKKYNDRQLNVFMGGRIALRRAISILYLQNDLYKVIAKSTGAVLCPPKAILSNSLGAPIVPAGFIGSISHKSNYAAALALNMHPLFKRSGHVGVDIEFCKHKGANDIARRLFSAQEIATLDGIGGLFSLEEEIMLRFSFKESIFKALNPFLKRYIEFKEAEVYPKPGGKVDIYFKLKTGEKFSYKAEWRRIDEECWLTCVHAWEYVAPAPVVYHAFDHGTDLSDL